MRLYSGKVGTIAADIVRTLTEGKDIEAENRAEVQKDIESVLNQYLRTEKEAADKAKDAMQARGIPPSEFARMKKLAAEQMGIKVGDETIDYLLDQILEILMHSANVDEIFSKTSFSVARWPPRSKSTWPSTKRSSARFEES